ncbi:hypothetical protein CC1G_02086 [Coprinopsis cinerea okayama7|uniref:Uncharacterized protein n=1 Tax=Coprinopsis cinerea (strain Okayama-7 / 130 / ATCC MYA-4618 / FGSC 9003) TaxID=240176 RepID=A8NK48_COPC7|nr:hypothetical protein CC1G_02086 [Coprinopsis cinerea okayama7\|eukprot:XP_001834350.2 hypothetical protein CC1G_02086 [Coprinopsis cinerea okayama7\
MVLVPRRPQDVPLQGAVTQEEGDATESKPKGRTNLLEYTFLVFGLFVVGTVLFHRLYWTRRRLRALHTASQSQGQAAHSITVVRRSRRPRSNPQHHSDRQSRHHHRRDTSHASDLLTQQPHLDYTYTYSYAYPSYQAGANDSTSGGTSLQVPPIAYAGGTAGRRADPDKDAPLPRYEPEGGPPKYDEIARVPLDATDGQSLTAQSRHIHQHRLINTVHPDLHHHRPP